MSRCATSPVYAHAQVAGGVSTWLLWSVFFSNVIGLRSENIHGNFDLRRLNHPKVPFALQPLQWGSVSPRGWIEEWARQASKGAGSPTKAVFAQIKVNNESVDGWRNGRPTVGGFWDEDSAYWIDGMTRLSLVLKDATLLDRVKRDVEFVVHNPDNFHNTWQGDVVEGWVRSIYSRALLAYYDGTGAQESLDLLITAFKNYTAADSTETSDETRQGSRSMTQMEALLEAHAYGGPSTLVDTALALMSPLAKNGGYEFMESLLSDECQRLDPTAVTAGQCEQHAHGVTYNEVAKLFAMGYSWSGNLSHLKASVAAFDLVDKFDTQPHGVNSADEDMNGIAPNTRTETCDVSDMIYSNSWMLRATGNGKYGDRMERAFINAAPGAVNRTFLGHVYFQSPNLSPADLVGLPSSTSAKFQEQWWHAPPCCTGNQVRMLPNFIHHMWFGTPDGGLAATMYGPNVVNTTVGVGGQRARVLVTVNTTYPFSTNISMTITVGTPATRVGKTPRDPADESEAGNIRFPLLLRVPAWCTKDTSMRVSIRTPGGSAVPVAWSRDAALPSFARIVRVWTSGDVVEISFDMELKSAVQKTVSNGWDPQAGNTWQDRLLGGGHVTVVPDLPFCTVSYGPLAFALPLETTRPAPLPFNFAVDCNASTMVIDTHASAMASPWDWPLNAPVTVRVRAIPFAWNSTWVLPTHALSTSNATGPAQWLTLIPYGNAKEFHVSMFPLWKP
eukprot:m.537174 g.537174  ORF g.537174 m.537174 type:complete len:729 (-) comp22073_c0_seq14:544-2730(-)